MITYKELSEKIRSSDSNMKSFRDLLEGNNWQQDWVEYYSYLKPILNDSFFEKSLKEIGVKVSNKHNKATKGEIETFVLAWLQDISNLLKSKESISNPTLYKKLKYFEKTLLSIKNKPGKIQGFLKKFI